MDEDTSLRQAAEWGMRAIQSSMPRLKDFKSAQATFKHFTFVVKETWLLSSGRPSYTKRRSFHVLQHDSWDALNFNTAQATFKLFTFVVKEM
jgi:hypothetical protein